MGRGWGVDRAWIGRGWGVDNSKRGLTKVVRRKKAVQMLSSPLPP